MSNASPKDLIALFSTLSNEELSALFRNPVKVKKFAQMLIKSTLPTIMTVGGRTYEILDFLQGDEEYVDSKTMIDRAKKMNANLGEDDCMHILKYQADIPVNLRNNTTFVFTDLRCRANSVDAVYIEWDEYDYRRWIWDWGSFNKNWFICSGRVLRRIE